MSATRPLGCAIVGCGMIARFHIRALADGVIETMKEHGYKGIRAEGYNEARWVLLDYGDVVVHIFAEDDREFYRLEEFWSGAPRLERPAEPERADEEPATVSQGARG